MNVRLLELTQVVLLIMFSASQARAALPTPSCQGGTYNTQDCENQPQTTSAPDTLEARAVLVMQQLPLQQRQQLLTVLQNLPADRQKTLVTLLEKLKEPQRGEFITLLAGLQAGDQQKFLLLINNLSDDQRTRLLDTLTKMTPPQRSQLLQLILGQGSDAQWQAILRLLPGGPSSSQSLP